MIFVTEHLSIDEKDLSESFVQASGPGGQNVNKVATAVSLRYDLYNAAGIPWDVKVRAARIAGRKVTREGAIVITAQRHRTQERNRADALERLVAILKEAAVPRSRASPPSRRGPARPAGWTRSPAVPGSSSSGEPRRTRARRAR